MFLKISYAPHTSSGVPIIIIIFFFLRFTIYFQHKDNAPILRPPSDIKIIFYVWDTNLKSTKKFIMDEFALLL